MSDEKIAFAEKPADVSVDVYLAELKRMEDNAVGVLSAPFQEVFNNFPEVEAIVWTQYAPYFNDGDPCIFSVNDLNFKLKSEDSTEVDEEEVDEDEDEYNEDADYSDYAWESDVKDSTTPLGQAEQTINSFAQSLENIFEKAFGSDSLVIATRDGFEVREYEHD